MPEAIDPLASVETSRVFFQLVLGRTTPKQIARSLGLSPPSVVEHLRKLQRIGVVELGEKAGKYQHYKINWKDFASVFMDHIYTPRLQEAALRSGEKKELQKELGLENRRLKRIVNELKRNVHFKELIESYFDRLTENMDSGLYPWRTVWGAIYEFEDSLESVPSKKKSVKDPEVLELLSMLEEWNRCARSFRRYGPRPAFESSVNVLEKSVEESR